MGSSLRQRAGKQRPVCQGVSDETLDEAVVGSRKRRYSTFGRAASRASYCEVIRTKF